MKKIDLLKVLIMVLFGVIMTMIVLSSCTPSNSSGNIPVYSTVRVKVLENNTINHLRIPNHLLPVYTYGDTVWVDLAKHVLDDTCDSAMQCVIETPASYDYLLQVDGTDTTNIYTIYDNRHNVIGTVNSHRLDSLINADNL